MSGHRSQYIMRHKRTWLTLLAVLALLSSWTLAQEESGSGEDGSGEEGGEEGGEGGEEAADEGGSGDSEDAGEDGGEESEDGGEDDEECEVEETDGSGSGDDDVANILALGGENKKCKPKSKDAESDGSGDEELSGADALADALGPTTCDKEGMDEKVAECLGGLENKVNDLMTAIMGPDGGGGTLEDKITLVLVKKGVISCENETQCDDNKQCLKQPDGMSRCQNPCERPEIIQ